MCIVTGWTRAVGLRGKNLCLLWSRLKFPNRAERQGHSANSPLKSAYTLMITMLIITMLMITMMITIMIIVMIRMMKTMTMTMT